MFRPLLLAAFCFGLALPSVAAERVMVGYFATFGDLPVEQIPWKSLTHVCHAFLRVDAQGKLVTTEAMPNAALTADGRKNGVPVIVTIGGGVTVSGLEKATVDAASMQAFVGEVLKVVRDGKYDGVDLDWEWPRDEATGAAHGRLIRELRRQLDAEAKKSSRPTRYLLTATVNPTEFFGQWVDAETVATQVDWLSVMAYDMAGPWSPHAAHHAPLFPSSKDPEQATRSVAAAMRYWESDRGVPKSKLVVGVPLYARSMPAQSPFEPLDTELARHHRALPFAAVRKLVGEGWRAEWDNESRAPWLSRPEAEKPAAAASPLTPVDPDVYDGPVLISYDDRNSVFGKATWAREQGYRGLFFWALHQDRMPDDRHWLLEAADKAWPAE
ncbi:Chitinase A1 precursor [Botrimarina colliarenosi]|uniref:chitinase n=1 Tax=Botrimarina colliarenosi TaxID=2528001 RepID=A0A5C6AKS0_9BACT|nr:glycoside hydrolase family 18 protein [Botrimarina colliarenosi]TWT99858.1 Chitinase A1 precursor [Botrimarina colliarenosi]